MNRIFIIEDDLKIKQELSVFLERNGYRVSSSERYSHIVEDALEISADLILLDINLPEVDGYHVCKEIRKLSEVPIIVVTSQNSDMDELMSINFGADDYITKPFNTQILLARIQNILKRTTTIQEKLVVEGVALNLSNGTLSKDGDNLELTKNEFRILHLLMSNTGRIVTRDEIMEHLWQSDAFIDDNTLTVNVNRLRKKLQSVGIEDFLKTKRGQGYII